MTGPGTEREPWLPDLCRLPRLAVMLGVAELVVVVLALSPDGGAPWDLERFVTASGFALWLALTVINGAVGMVTAHQPLRSELMVGSLVFGAGWGLAGFCPGPAIVSAGAGQPKAIVFVLAMLAGMWLFEIAEGRMRRNPNQQAGAL